MAVGVEELILSMAPDPITTAERWAVLTDGPPACFDERFLFHLYSHHVGAIAYDAIIELGWDAMLPPFLITVLSRMGGLSEEVWNVHYDSLLGLSRADPGLIGESLVVKGALLGLQYASKRHRVMGDFDLIVPAEAMPATLELLTANGFKRRSDMAYDMLKDVGPLYTGAGQVAMHVWEMPAGWERHVADGELGEVRCRVPSPELHLVELLMNAHEHSASWYYALWESDLQFIRSLDIELICGGRTSVDASRFWDTAVDLGLAAEVALGLWVHREFSGTLPQGWEVLQPQLDAVAPVANMYALPVSVDVEQRVAEWPLAVRERAFHASRHQLAIDLLPPRQRGVDFIDAMKNAKVSHQQPVHEIVARARESLASVPGGAGRTGR